MMCNCDGCKKMRENMPTPTLRQLAKMTMQISVMISLYEVGLAKAGFTQEQVDKEGDDMVKAMASNVETLVKMSPSDLMGKLQAAMARTGVDVFGGNMDDEIPPMFTQHGPKTIH